MILRLFFIYFYFLFPAFSGYLTIHDMNDCGRVDGNLSSFWKANRSLIPKIQKNEILDPEEKDKLILNDDPIVQKMIREFKKDKKQVYEDIENALIYTKNHKEEIKDRFDNVTFLNLLGGLNALKKLINQFDFLSNKG